MVGKQNCSSQGNKMTQEIIHKIASLTPESKKLLLLRAKEMIATQSQKKAESKRITAYIKGKDNFSIEELKAKLQKKLPDYMMPSQFFLVTNIPLLPNGKIDTKKLQENSSIKIMPVSKETKANDTSNNVENTLLQIWEETLGFSPIHKDDNFFEIGGDSILSIQIIAKARKQGLVLEPNALFEHQTIAELSLFVNSSEVASTSSSFEDTLIQIWEETLGFSPVLKDDNFFEIGGDSILSIQIIAKARKQGLVLEPSALFEHQTIAELSLFVKKEHQKNEDKIVKGNISLTPIQNWFFKDHKNEPNFWNQGVKLDGLQKIAKEQVQKVCDYIITQHDALRAKFVKEENEWIQNIVNPTEIDVLEYIDFTTISSDEYQTKTNFQIQRIQEKFEITEGSLFKCLYFKTDKNNTDFCIFIAHHLVVDAVSWQIITDDFIDALEQITKNDTIVSESKTSSIKDWSQYLKKYSYSISEKEINFWKQQITNPFRLPVDLKNEIIIQEKDVVQYHFSLQQDITSQLASANKVYNTKTEELLITAFSNAILNWSNTSTITFGFERHGRETSETTLNLSKTVGWFTAYFPVKLEHNQNDEKNNIIATKEKMRQIPNGGIGYGVLRYLTSFFKDVENPEIVFNFLGNKTTNTSNNRIKVSTLYKNLRAPNSERKYKLEVNLQIVDQVLQGVISYSKNIHTEETITKIINNFKNQLHNIINHCNEHESGGYTPSDFSETEISQDDLDNLLDALS